jgi:hypothetical protein
MLSIIARPRLIHFPLDRFADNARSPTGGTRRTLAQMVGVPLGCIASRRTRENHSLPPERSFCAVVGDAETAV